MVVKKHVKFKEPAPVDNQEREEDLTDKKNYSLDSDEEDIDISSKKLDVDDIDGQEDTTLRQEGQQAITPFNLDDENEEGHFDENGNFIFDKKTKEEIRDNWLDSIDMHKLPAKVPVPPDKASKESTPDPLSKLAPSEILQQIVDILQPTESVTKALQRLGGSQLSASQRLKLKKKGQLPAPSSQREKERLDELTSLCDWLLHQGRDTIYQDTHEKLTFEIRQASEDIFGADDEAGESSGKHKKRKLNEPAVTTELNWYYTVDGNLHHGPVSSSGMLEMQNKGSLQAGTKVFKETNREVMYDAKRINFEDYID